MTDDPMRIFSHYLDEMSYLYSSTENQFIEFSEIVPLYQNTFNVYSPRLYSILQLTCSQIESMIKRIVNEFRLTPRQEKNILPYYQELQKNELLEKQTVMLVPAWKIIRPFPNNSLPKWWSAYNDTKHQLPQGVMSGTIENTTNALAGLYCLHNIAFLIMHGSTYDVTNKENWSEWTYPKFLNRDLDSWNARTPEVTHNWKSKLFHHTRFYMNPSKISEN